MSIAHLRPACAADRPFLVAVYGSTRAEELALAPWTDEQKRAFIEMQFDAQSSAYAAYDGTSHSIILVNGTDAGHLYLAHWPGELRIVDIALLPEFRGLGIGTQLLKDVIAVAEAENKKVTIHVEQFNPALRLYDRLGFQQADSTGIYLRLEHHPRTNA